MTDIEQIRRALQTIASGTEDIEPPYRAMPPEYYRRIAADALPILDRVAARVGESEMAPKWPYGNPYIGDSALVPCRVEHFYPEVVSGHGDMVKLSIGSAEVIVPVSWARALPPPPETDDERN